MKTFIEELAYGEEKTVKFNGKYLKGFARAVDAGKPVANAEILLMSDDSDEKSEIQLIYAVNASMSEYAFFEMNDYIPNGNLIDIIPFNYVKLRYNINETGVIIVAKAPTTISDLAKAFK